MKKIMKMAVCASIVSFMFLGTKAQEVASLSPGEYPSAKAVTDKPAAPDAPKKEVTVTLKNSAEKTVVIFAGHKEDIRDPKVQTVGGLSKNNLYLKEDDVVCIMTTERKPMACTAIKNGVTSVEVNPSANGISGK